MEELQHRSEEEVRLEKLKDLEAQGINCYVDTVLRTHTVAEVLQDFENLLESKTEVILAGRLMGARWHGGSAFADLQDMSGRMQLHLRKDIIGEATYVLLKKNLDHADFLEIKGTVLLTKVGERTVEVTRATLLSKALRPLPEKWHGLQDIETRYRERELDLLSNPEVRERFIVRSKIVSSLRTFLDTQGFLEVETPLLQTIPGGANARPFLTHHNALDIPLYLRIAPELYLKRLIVGGFEKIYEIGRCFRNEGIDYAHNPEFTMIELYWAYVDKKVFVDFLENLMRSVLETTQEKNDVWTQTTFRQAIIDACGIDIDLCKNSEELLAATRRVGIAVDFKGLVGLGEQYDELFKKTARAKITAPTWVFDYPLELKPLAKALVADPTKSASVQLIIDGAEIVNAYYHELNDPIEQRARFFEQQKLRDAGSEEAQWMDEDFLRALEHGMPPTAGVGIGIDRLVAFITKSPSLKEVILFPTLRPQSTDV